MKDPKPKAKGSVKSEIAKKATRWQITENNPERDKNEVARVLGSLGKATYVAVCSEVGDMGTVHIHGFVVYENAISANTIKKAFPRAHLETCKGSSEENRAYIAKQDENFLEVGNCPIVEKAPRQRDEASEVLALMFDESNNEGRHPLEVAREHPEFAYFIVRNYRGLSEMWADFQDPRKRQKNWSKFLRS